MTKLRNYLVDFPLFSPPSDMQISDPFNKKINKFTCVFLVVFLWSNSNGLKNEFGAETPPEFYTTNIKSTNSMHQGRDRKSRFDVDLSVTHKHVIMWCVFLSQHVQKKTAIKGNRCVDGDTSVHSKVILKRKPLGKRRALRIQRTAYETPRRSCKADPHPHCMCHRVAMLYIPLAIFFFFNTKHRRQAEDWLHKCCWITRQEQPPGLPKVLQKELHLPHFFFFFLRGKNGPRGKQKVKAASYSDEFFKTKPTLALAHVLRLLDD